MLRFRRKQHLHLQGKVVHEPTLLRLHDPQKALHSRETSLTHRQSVTYQKTWIRFTMPCTFVNKHFTTTDLHGEAPHSVQHLRFFLLTTAVAISFANTWHQVFVASEDYHEIVTADIRVDNTSWRLQGNTERYTGGGSATARERRKVDPWDSLPYSQHILTTPLAFP